MPRFYFHLDGGQRCRKGDEVIALPDTEAAWYHAYRSADAILTSPAPGDAPLPGAMLRVRDERGREVLTLSLAELLQLPT